MTSCSCPVQFVPGRSNSTNPTHTNARRPASIRYTAPMGILIGMDEAGYGPNFGPLVVAAPAWHCADPGEVASATGLNNRKLRSAASASTCAVVDANPQSARSL